ncbi:MAG: hypothetical protein ACI9SP_000933 [Arenicella sp.]|jgi:hypothetical protein
MTCFKFRKLTIQLTNSREYMFFRNSKIILLLLALVSAPSYAGFPNDLDDVVFIEEGKGPRLVGLTQYVRGMAVTGEFSVDLGGPDSFGGTQVILNNSRKGDWPNNIFDCCNANAWVVVKVGETWYAGTWEFVRVNQTIKSTLALVGPGHIKHAPLGRFAPKAGEIYGFFNSCITRNGIQSDKSNCRERSNIALYKWGQGPVGFDAIGAGEMPVEESTPSISPAIDLLFDSSDG